MLKHPKFSETPSRRRGRTVAAILAVAAMGVATARGQSITEFEIPTAGSIPDGIAAGPDGNLWFTERGTNKIGRITTTGVIAEFTIAAASFPTRIAAGPDGNLWFIETPVPGKIGRMTPAGALTEFTLGTPDRVAFDITAGPDGNMWFPFSSFSGGRIGRITPSGIVTEFPVPTVNETPTGIAAGPDGNMWFTEQPVAKIGRITTAGVITEFAIPTANRNVKNIAAGPDGNLWFTESLPPEGVPPEAEKIGRITTAGAVSEFPIPVSGSSPFGIAAGPDGNMWFTEQVANKIGKITTAGVITEITIPTPFSYPQGIAAGPDGNLWFTESNGNKIGRITTSGASCAPSATNLCLNNARFQVEAAWHTMDGTSGLGQAVPTTSSTGAFWFFSPDNLELVVKVLDGRSINRNFWVFYGSLTNVEFTLTVTDTETGAQRFYINSQGQLASVADTSAF